MCSVQFRGNFHLFHKNSLKKFQNDIFPFLFRDSSGLYTEQGLRKDKVERMSTKLDMNKCKSRQDKYKNRQNYC